MEHRADTDALLVQLDYYKKESDSLLGEVGRLKDVESDTIYFKKRIYDLEAQLASLKSTGVAQRAAKVPKPGEMLSSRTYKRRQERSEMVLDSIHSVDSKSRALVFFIYF